MRFRGRVLILNKVPLLESNYFIIIWCTTSTFYPSLCLKGDQTEIEVGSIIVVCYKFHKNVLHGPNQILSLIKSSGLGPGFQNLPSLKPHPKHGSDSPCCPVACVIFWISSHHTILHVDHNCYSLLAQLLPPLTSASMRGLLSFSFLLPTWESCILFWLSPPQSMQLLTSPPCPHHLRSISTILWFGNLVLCHELDGKFKLKLYSF